MRPYVLRFKIFHYYLIPLVALVVWWGMLIALLSCWSLQGHPIYSFMTGHQDPVYLSDVAATNLQPLFISCAGFQGIFFVGSLVVEFILRIKGKLQPYIDKRQYHFAIISIVCAIIGELGILMVSIFNTKVFHDVHISMVGVFIAFIFFSCCFNFATYYIFGRNPSKLSPQSKRVFFGPKKWQNIYIINLILKLIWLVVAFILAIAFGTLMHNGHDSKSADFEWTICFWYGLLLISWSIDLIPAAYHHYKKRHSTLTDEEKQTSSETNSNPLVGDEENNPIPANTDTNLEYPPASVAR